MADPVALIYQKIDVIRFNYQYSKDTDKKCFMRLDCRNYEILNMSIFHETRLVKIYNENIFIGLCCLNSLKITLKIVLSDSIDRVYWIKIQRYELLTLSVSDA